MSKIEFLGASGGVTGSSYLLTGDNGSTILIDLGMFQGEDDRGDINFLPLKFDVKSLQAVLLTHAHLDHCGRLPFLIKQGFSGKIYATSATKDIANLSLLDAAKISDERNGPILYTADEVENICSKIEATSYDSPFQIGDFSITFRDAGHILGSASIEVWEKGKDGLVFSGDLGNSPQDLIKATENIKQAGVILMESTYGDKVHPQEDASAILQAEINYVEKSGGTLLIPAFSIERSQEILHRIGHLRKNGKIGSSIPIFFDSPMAIEVTEIFKKYPKLYNLELSADNEPFNFPNLTSTITSDESKAIFKTKGPKVIIAGSGMMTGGRILHHLENYISQPLTRILVVGYQAVGTLGREILEGAKKVSIYNKQLSVGATVTSMQALSSHADQPKLLLWLKSIQGVRQVFLVHGEKAQRTVLSEKIKADLNISNIILPMAEQVHEIG